MIAGIGKFLVKIFGSRNDRLVKGYMGIARAAGDYEQQIESLSDEALKAKTSEFKDRIRGGVDPEVLLPEAFAVVREAAKRNMEMRHYDVQLIGGNVIYEGKIAEMATGEGKTLVATLSAYLVHLTGRGVHVVTVNDYLAKRDAEWMRPTFEALGLSVGAIQSEMDAGGQERKGQYQCDITYGTNNEFGFDYLRDNMKLSFDRMVQGKLEFAIIDEVDSILIDEARTPLIISGPAFDDVTRYKKSDAVVRQLIEKQSSYDTVKRNMDLAERTCANAEGEYSDAKKLKDSERMSKAKAVIDKCQSDYDRFEAELETKVQYYEVEMDRKSVHLTNEGIIAAQEFAGVGSFFTGSNMDWPHLLEQGLRAHVTFEREKDYVVMDGKVVIVDEFTGRLMDGRQWSDGLHQAVEAKENVQVKEETQTLATVTLQNFFKLYQQISGMTGTALTEMKEFNDIYGLEVVTIPTNKPIARDDRQDAIYKSEKEKFNAIVDEINEASGAGRPVLIGTVSIEKSEAISNVLKRKFGIEHEVLNAKQHMREASIVEKAGFQHTDRRGITRGNVTIATNMAGRGTDIKLGEGVADLGGLHIVGTERHESRRIDNQLRGRAGRQGDNGSSQFFLSFDDDLLKIFSPEWTIKALSWIGWEEGMPIQHRSISKGIEKAQRKVEERNYEARKSLLEYDEVMDYQRKGFYSRRVQILKGEELKPVIYEMIKNVIADGCETVLNDDYASNCVVEWAKSNFGVELEPKSVKNLDADAIEEKIKDHASRNVTNEITISLGEYLGDYEDKSTWNLSDLSKWAMSAFKVNLSVARLKDMESDEIEETLIEAACEQVMKKDCSYVLEFLKEGYALRVFTELSSTKFDIELEESELAELNKEDVYELVLSKVDAKYRQREIEYPAEFAMNMVFTPEGINANGFDSLVKWANSKFDAGIGIEDIQELSPGAIVQKFIEMNRRMYDGGLVEQIEAKYTSLGEEDFCGWAKERFNAELDESVEGDAVKGAVVEAGFEFLRQELSHLERYVMLQVYDAAWKDHLYSMDHLKESIFLRSFAEKDPKTEYKQEGYRMFKEMLNTVEQRISSMILKVRLESKAAQRNVYNVSKASHEQVNQFSASERQRAAAMAPQGDRRVKQIVNDEPKVGRNDLCPCGSGKKYKKCCGLN